MWGDYALALDGLPDDVATLAYDVLSRLGASPQTYRLPLLVSESFVGFVAGAVPLLWEFSTVGIIFGISQHVELSAGGAASVLRLSVNIQDASASRNLVGTADNPFSLTGIPDTQLTGTDQLRVSPMSCYPETQWTGQLSADPALAANVDGVINLYGVGFWEAGRNLTSRQGAHQPGLGAQVMTSPYGR